MGSIEQLQHHIAETESEKPRYALRRTMAGAAAILATLGGAKAVELGADGVRVVEEAVTTSTYDKYACEDNRSITIIEGETVWGKAAKPLADELDISIDAALTILQTANPDTNLGQVQPGTTIVVPTCHK